MSSASLFSDQNLCEETFLVHSSILFSSQKCTLYVKSELVDTAAVVRSNRCYTVFVTSTGALIKSVKDSCCSNSGIAHGKQRR